MNLARESKRAREGGEKERERERKTLVRTGAKGEYPELKRRE